MSRFLASAMVLLAMLAAVGAGASAQVSAQTRSPHGNLNVPCQNCHTSLGWKPIRAVPEFDHNKTNYPLRGMHENVSCTQCHTKPVFSNVGNKCSDCHADIHRGQMGARCDSCHTVKGWNVAVKDIQNHENRFPLLGAHAALDCDSCHKNAAVGQFQGLSTQCYSCHADVFKKTTNPNHVAGGFSTTCEGCHSVDTWLNARFDHSQTGFALTGMHQSVPCAQCHVNNNYNLTSANATCVSCHLKDFQTAKNPDHVAGQFSQNCQQCHNTAGWSPAQFDHSSVGFALTGGHANVQCAQCHVNNNYTLTSKACSTCHMTDYNNTNNPNHAAQGIPTTCETCHTVNSWTTATFDHSSVGFPLTGGHANVQCSQCHVNNNYNLTSKTCSTCHMKDYNGTTNPNHVQQGIPTTCETCHTIAGWTPAQFDHSKMGFPLTGFHLTSTTCAQCHVNNNYNLTNTACVSCHQTDYNNAITPINHVQQNFPTTCQNCHDTVLWTDGKFDHSTTGWPITGFHLTSTQCSQCHINNNYNLTSANTACVSCHQTDYNTATTPVNHVQLGFPTTCQNCHDTVLWTDGKFDHSTTGWPLTGFHLTSTQCAQCHVNNNYSLTSANTACVSCHQTDYNNATTPVNHVQLGFPTTCQNCHDTVLWTDGKFDHSTTGWPLTGFHLTSTQCAQCHINNNYSLTSANTACVGCHQTDYNTATTPINHVQLGFPTTCQNCHDTVLWTDGKFDHSTTGWPLTGFHLTSTQCSQCHINNNYNLTSANTACVSCHQTDYNTATTPVNHVQLGFPTTCQNCHDTVLWTDGKFDHSTTGWSLTGFHLTSTQCSQCHVNNNYSLTSANTVCSSCHMTDYTTATTPVNHVSAGFPTTCDLCHDTVLWMDGKFDHTTTGWPLTGTHLTTPCAQCHVNSNYKLTNTACVACHQTDYNGAVTPVNHVQLGFPTTCQNCHDTVVWTDGKFDHSSTGWPLTGFHATVQCALCHVNNNYSLTSANTVCSTCHMADYNTTNNPNHSAAGWPTTCDTCHTTTAWIPAQLPTQYHTFFPVTHGNANGVCATCHQNPNDFSVFQCTNCHQKAQTDSNHQGVSGYVYNSANCYNCHKNGGGG